MTRRCMVLLAALLVPATAPAQWEPQPSGTEARLRGLSVVDQHVAWASGGGGTVLRTTDGGSTWRPRPVPGAAGLEFRDIEAFDAETALVLSIGEGEASRIYKTTDGGASWQLQYTNPDPAGFLDALAFWDEDRGLALGDPVGGRFAILWTEDGGRTWDAIPDEGMPPSLPGEAAFAASGTCLIVREGDLAWFATGGASTARVFRSTDRGKSWTAHETPAQAGNASSGIFSLAFRDKDHGVAVGGNFLRPEQAGRAAIRTSDGGRTWALATGTPPSGYRSAVADVPGSAPPTLIAVGPTGSDVSTDGGNSWKPLGTSGFDAARFARPDAGWASGEGGRISRFVGPAAP